MQTYARLIPVRTPRYVDGVVLVLHGGGSREPDRRVSPTQLSVVRMVPIARAVARAGRGRLAVFRLLNSVRGWDAAHTPVEDVRWALGQIAGRYPGRPVGLIGHSLGGRAALLAAGHAQVRSVAALAPWLTGDDGARVDAPGAQVLVVHGTADRIASPARSQAAARRMAPAVRSVSWQPVEGGKHAMLSRHAAFVRPAVDFTVSTLLAVDADGREHHPPVRRP